MKNLPIETYESVAQQRDELEKKLTESERKVEQLESLARLVSAENVSIVSAAVSAVGHWSAASKGEMSFMMDKCMPELRDSIQNTPATDSFLAEVRANGVEMLSEHLIELVHKWQSHGATSEDVRDYLELVKYALGFATQIRQGEKS